MCVNDLYCSGAEPAFFLDYFSCGKLNETVYSTVLESIIKACRSVGIALLGGETAEHPDVMSDEYFDLAGFCVGFVCPDDRLPKTNTFQAGDVIAALASTGLHSNGFSLIRMILETLKVKRPKEYASLVDDPKWLREKLLTPTRIYKELPEIMNIVKVKGIAHVTGGGIYENLPRVFPDKFAAIIEEKKPFFLPIYEWLGDFASEKELYSTFNMGCGILIILDAGQYSLLKKHHKEVKQIGHVEVRNNISSESAERVFIRGIDTF